MIAFTRTAIIVGLAAAAASLNAAPAFASPIGPAVTLLQTTTVTTEIQRGGSVVDQRTATTPEYTYFFDDTNPFAPHPGAISLNHLANPAEYVEVDSPFGPATLSAHLPTSGAAFARVDAQRNASLVAEQTVLRAEVSQTMRNKFDAETDHLEFEFSLDGMSFELWDRAGVPGGPNPINVATSEAIGGRIYYEVLRDGIPFYRSIVVAFGKLDGFLSFATPFSDIVNGQDRNGDFIARIVADAPVFGGPGIVPQGFLYEGVDNTAASATANGAPLDLGPVGRGEEFEVVARMGAELYLPAFFLGAGGRVTIGDPNALGAGGLGVLRTATPAAQPVPAPASVWLMLSGLLALAAVRRGSA